MTARAAASSIVVLIAAFGAISAHAATVRESDGTKFEVEYNRHGAVLRGRNAVIYIGVNCDARYSRGEGRGQWRWANGGFEVHIAGERLLFARQELSVRDCGRCRR